MHMIWILFSHFNFLSYLEFRPFDTSKEERKNERKKDRKKERKRERKEKNEKEDVSKDEKNCYVGIMIQITTPWGYLISERLLEISKDVRNYILFCSAMSYLFRKNLRWIQWDKRKWTHLVHPDILHHFDKAW